MANPTTFKLKKKGVRQITELPHGCVVPSNPVAFSSALPIRLFDGTTDSILMIPFYSDDFIRIANNDSILRVPHNQMVGSRGWSHPVQIDPWGGVYAAPIGSCQNVIQYDLNADTIANLLPTGLSGENYFCAPILDDDYNIWYMPEISNHVLKIRTWNDTVATFPARMTPGPYTDLIIQCSAYDRETGLIWAFGTKNAAAANYFILVDTLSNGISYVLDPSDGSYYSCQLVGDYIWVFPRSGTSPILKINRFTRVITQLPHGQLTSRVFYPVVYDKNNDVFYLAYKEGICRFDIATEQTVATYSSPWKNLALNTIGRSNFNTVSFDGRSVWYLPGAYNKVMVFDTVNNNWSTFAHRQEIDLVTPFSGDLFFGGIFNHEKEKIYLVPLAASNVIKIDAWHPDEEQADAVDPIEFDFTNKVPGIYQVAPMSFTGASLPEQVITVPNKANVEVVNSNVDNVDFTQQFFNISGTVWKQFDTGYYLSNGSSTPVPNVPYDNVQVRLDEMRLYDDGVNYEISYTRYTMTDVDGNYNFDNVPSNGQNYGQGNYYKISLDRIDTNFHFTWNGMPVSNDNSIDSNERRHIRVEEANVRMQDMRRSHYLIYGYAFDTETMNPLANVAMTLYDNDTDTIIDSCLSDYDGYIIFWVSDISYLELGVPTLRNYRIEGELTGWSFNMVPATFNVGTYGVGGSFNHIYVSPEGTLNKYTLSGHTVPAVENVSIDGGSLGTQMTDINGYYEFTNISHGTSYTLTPSKNNYTFDPVNSSGTLIDNTSVDFTAMHETQFISGTLEQLGSPAPGATVQLADLNLDLTGFNGMVQPIVKDGNYLYVGGQFTQYKGVNCYRIAKIDLTTGNLAAGFNTGTGFSGGGNDTRSIVISGNDLYVGGHFTNYNGTTRQAIAKLNATTGAVDLTFDSASGCGGPSPVVNNILLSGGSLYLSGAMTTYKGINRTRFCKINATTAALDATFDTATGFGAETSAIALNGNDLYVGGGFTTYKGTARKRILKLNATTAALDGTFDSAVGFDINNVRRIIYDGGSLFVGGEFTTYKGTARQYVAKLNATTAALDGTFDSAVGFDAAVRHMEYTGTSLYCSGSFTTYKGTARQRIAKLNPSTAALDSIFDSSTGAADNSILKFVLDGDDLYITGNFTQYQSITRQGLAKINATDAGLGGLIPPATTLTDLDGFYKFGSLSNSTYSVRPVIVGYTYTPRYMQAIILNNYAENVDFN